MNATFMLMALVAAPFDHTDFEAQLATCYTENLLQGGAGDGRKCVIQLPPGRQDLAQPLAICPGVTLQGWGDNPHHGTVLVRNEGVVGVHARRWSDCDDEGATKSGRIHLENFRVQNFGAQTESSTTPAVFVEHLATLRDVLINFAEGPGLVVEGGRPLSAANGVILDNVTVNDTGGPGIWFRPRAGNIGDANNGKFDFVQVTNTCRLETEAEGCHPIIDASLGVTGFAVVAPRAHITTAIVCTNPSSACNLDVYVEGDRVVAGPTTAEFHGRTNDAVGGAVLYRGSRILGEGIRIARQDGALTEFDTAGPFIRLIPPGGDAKKSWGIGWRPAWGANCPHEHWSIRRGEVNAGSTARWCEVGSTLWRLYGLP